VTEIISETRERFLLAISKEIAPERIEELYFFQQARQGGIESGVAVIAATGGEADPAQRCTVYSARYRLMLKGPDRGHWETTIVEEADAPRDAVETVVRGVQRRAGDLEDADRMDGDAAREIIGAKR
jgi:hypothetical protein